MSFSRNLKSSCEKIWEDGYNHPFVQELGKGILSKEKFKFYLLQDYIYLFEYAKIFALATVKSKNKKLITNFSKTQYEIINIELNIHKKYMRKFGISEKEINCAKPSLFNKAYTSSMISYGLTGNLAEILAAVFPCAWTYYDYATRLRKKYNNLLEKNFYKSWILNYSSEQFLDSFEWFYDTLDELVSNMTELQRKNIQEIFSSSIEFEYLFWDMSYKQQMGYKI